MKGCAITLGLLIAALCAFLALLIADLIFATPYPRTGTVLAKSYAPSSSSVGTGVVPSGNSVTVVTTTSYTPEAWVLVVSSDAETKTIETTATNWAKFEKGDDIQFNDCVGPWLGTSSWRLP